jgi:hypothetical protein
MTTALLNATPVEFRQSNQDPRQAAASAPITITTTIGLSWDDLVGLLYKLGKAGWTDAELADDEYLREVIVDYAINGGLMDLNEGTCVLARVQPGTEDHDFLIHCQDRVAELFPAAVPAGLVRELAGTGVAR